MAILTFLAIAAGTWAIGKVVDYVWTKGEKALGIESQEEKDAKRDSAEAKAMLDSVAKFRSSMKKGLGGIEQGLSRETESLLKLDKVLDDSGQTMSQLMSSITFLDNLVDQHANKAENIQQVVKDDAAVIKESMKKFKSDLVHLNDVEKEILFKVELLEENFADALRLGLTEHEAWKAERSILRFFHDLKLHSQVADEGAQLPRAEGEEIVDHIAAFVRSMRSPLNGVTTDLWKLRTTYALLDADPKSSRGIIYEGFGQAVQSYLDKKITIDDLREALKRAFNFLTSSYTMALELIWYISPDDAYKFYYSQQALVDLEVIAQKLDAHLPQGDKKLRDDLMAPNLKAR